MIEKERLEELIKQGATIWKKEPGCVREIKAEHIPTFWCEYRWDFYCKYFFETKEDAEFALKYQNITRTETLSLPTWEEVTINDKYNYYGISYFEFGDGYRLFVKLPSEDNDCEFVGIDVNKNCELYHWEEATKENYLEACELCKKIFFGEKIMMDKFKNVESLEKSYNELEKRFTIKCQECAEKNAALMELKAEFDMYRSMAIEKSLDPNVVKLIRNLIFIEIREKIEKMKNIEFSTYVDLLKILDDIEG